MNKYPYEKPKISRVTKAMSWSEILMKIQYYVEQHSSNKSIKN